MPLLECFLWYRHLNIWFFSLCWPRPHLIKLSSFKQRQIQNKSKAVEPEMHLYHMIWSTCMRTNWKKNVGAFIYDTLHEKYVCSRRSVQFTALNLWAFQTTINFRNLNNHDTKQQIVAIIIFLQIYTTASVHIAIGNHFSVPSFYQHVTDT